MNTAKRQITASTNHIRNAKGVSTFSHITVISACTGISQKAYRTVTKGAIDQVTAIVSGRCRTFVLDIRMDVLFTDDHLITASVRPMGHRNPRTPRFVIVPDRQKSNEERTLLTKSARRRHRIIIISLRIRRVLFCVSFRSSLVTHHDRIITRGPISGISVAAIWSRTIEGSCQSPATAS